VEEAGREYAKLYEAARAFEAQDKRARSVPTYASSGKAGQGLEQPASVTEEVPPGSDSRPGAGEAEPAGRGQGASDRGKRTKPKAAGTSNKSIEERSSGFPQMAGKPLRTKNMADNTIQQQMREFRAEVLTASNSTGDGRFLGGMVSPVPHACAHVAKSRTTMRAS